MQINKNLIFNESTSFSESEDVPTFDLIFKQFYAPLYAFASRYVASDEIEDIVQETMIWLWENKDSIDANKSLKSLLFTIVKNKCLNRVSHKQVRNEVHQNLFKKFEAQFEDPNFYSQSELMQKLDDAIKKLPTDYREAFEMNRYKDMTYQQIADMTGVSAKTIAYRISQALKILRVELKDYLPLLVFLYLVR